MHKITAQTEILVLLLLIAFSVLLVGGLKVSIGPNYPKTAGSFLTGKHGAFIAGTLQEVDMAHAAGISYVINYSSYGNSENSVNPNSATGQELAKFGMKTYLDLHTNNCQINPNITSLVSKYDKSPILGGYWIKDDDVPGCNMIPQLQATYKAIRSIDSDPTHIIMAGYGVASSMSNYAPGIADVLAFYPYPAYNEGHTVEWHIQQMLASEKSATPPGQKPPPFVGVYQAFWGDGNLIPGCDTSIPRRVVSLLSDAEVTNDVSIYMKYGAVGVVAFSIGMPCDVNHTAINDTTIQNQIMMVNNLLKTTIGQ